MKRVVIISFFIIFPLAAALAAPEWGGSRWHALSEGGGMRALLVLELNPGGSCSVTHAYLREGEELPFEEKTTRENWYFDGRERLFITDSWGEFASFLWEEDKKRLVTVIGGEEIVLTPLSDGAWRDLRESFSLDTGQ